jgi:hypothetical protein
MQLEAVKKMKMQAVKLKLIILKNRLLKSKKNTMIWKKFGKLKKHWLKVIKKAQLNLIKHVLL